MPNRYQRLCTVVFFFVTLLVMRPVNGQTPHSESLANFLTNDVVGVLYVDLDKIDLEGALQTATKLGFREQDELSDFVEALPLIEAEMGKLEQAGLNRIYGLLRTEDIQSMGTSWVLPLRPGADSAAAKSAIERIAGMLPPGPFAETGSVPGVLLMSATQTQMERLKTARPTVDSPRQEMWKALGNGAIGLVLFGDDDSRRVIRELMPKLPPPFEAVTGQLIADGLDWGGIEIGLAEKPSLKITVEAKNENVAAALEKSVNDGFDVLQQLPKLRQIFTESESEFILRGITPVRQENRLTLSTEKLAADMDQLAKLLSPQVKAVRAEAARTSQINSLRQLALAMHNFDSAYKHFPTQAKVDENGKPLLSWRVQILPFIEQGTLYEQFHLDEPWDSEHNLKLVKMMPKVFEDPNPASRQNNNSGKTVYLGPAGEGMIFNGRKEIRFQDISDGSSNTVMLVVAAKEHAVPWTKPTDWQIDLENPTIQLQESGRTHVEVVLGDGSTQTIPLSANLKTWRRLVQIADGEIVELPR